jgi:hypothetical protein
MSDLRYQSVSQSRLARSASTVDHKQAYEVGALRCPITHTTSGRRAFVCFDPEFAMPHRSGRKEKSLRKRSHSHMMAGVNVARPN